jgi:hypothetical protein
VLSPQSPVLALVVTLHLALTFVNSSFIKLSSNYPVECIICSLPGPWLTGSLKRQGITHPSLSVSGWHNQTWKQVSQTWKQVSLHSKTSASARSDCTAWGVSQKNQQVGHLGWDPALSSRNKLFCPMLRTTATQGAFSGLFFLKFRCAVLTLIPCRYCGFGTRLLQWSKYCNKENHRPGAGGSHL